MAVDPAIIIAAVVLLLIIIILVVGMLICHFCCRSKDRETGLPLTNSEGHKSVGPREVRSNGSFPYTPIRAMDKPKQPRKIQDVEPDDADAKNKKLKTSNDDRIKTTPNNTIKKVQTGSNLRASPIVTVKNNPLVKRHGSKGKLSSKKRSKEVVSGGKNNPKIIIARGPEGSTSPPLSPNSPDQSTLESPKTSPDSTNSSPKSPGTGSNMTSDSAPEPTPITTQLENQVNLVDDKTVSK